jgi:vWA domain found in the FtsH ternary systems/N-terminal helical region fused to the FtsH ternary system vWA domain
MNHEIIRDSLAARRFLLQGLWWQRVQAPTGTTVRLILSWAKEVTSAGQPLPPIGFLADLGFLALSDDLDVRPGREAFANSPIPVSLAGMVGNYEDHVLGKLIADWTFGRASDALRRYAKGREQARGLAYLLNQFRERSRFPGVEIVPGVVNTALESQPEELLSEGYESIQVEGLDPIFERLYQGLLDSARRTPEILDAADVFDLEHRTALNEPSQRLAHRQVLKAAGSLEATLPRARIRPLARRMEVPTRILDEDTYPVGGFTSISNRGSIESLLHSQLAYMEPTGADRPDLFDTLFLMDELLYYSRDENQFLRRRRNFVFVLSADLVDTRFKDPELPYQRGVMLLGLLFVLVRKLTEWLNTDALTFRFVFPPEGRKDGGRAALATEWGLLETLLSEPIKQGAVILERVAPRELVSYCEHLTRRSMVHALVCGVEPSVLDAEEAVATRLQIRSAWPMLGDGTEEPEAVEGENALEAWGQALQGVIGRWI